MVRVLTKEELFLEPNLVNKLKNSIFIYPTDTIYGIGCDATNEALVKKIRALKKRSEQPFSVIVPNKAFIEDNCESGDDVKKWMDILPGPYTLILNVKKSFFARNVNSGQDTIGVRIPKHWFYDIIKKMNIPIVTTSVNVSGEDFMTCLDDLNSDIKKGVDFIVYDGPLSGKPSTIVHLENSVVQVKNRQ